MRCDHTHTPCVCATSPLGILAIISNKLFDRITRTHARTQVGKYEAVGTTEPPIMDGTFRGTVDTDGTVKKVDGTVKSEKPASAATAAAKQEAGHHGAATAGAGGGGGGGSGEGEVGGDSHDAKRLRLDEEGATNGDGVKKGVPEGKEEGARDEDEGEATDDEETQVKLLLYRYIHVEVVCVNLPVSQRKRCYSSV